MIGYLLISSFTLTGLLLTLRPKWLLYFLFLLGPLPLSPLVTNPFMETPLGLVNIGALKVASILLIVTVGVLLTPMRLSKAASGIGLMLAFLVYAVISLSWADNPTIGIRMLLKLMTPILVFFYLFGNVHRIGLQALFSAATFSGLLYLCYGLLTSHNLSLAGLSIPGASRAEYSGHLVSVIAMLAAQCAFQPSILRLSTLLLLSAGTVAAFTRITIASMFAALGSAWFWRSRGPLKYLWPVLGVAAFLALFVFVDEFRQRMFLTSADSVTLESLVTQPLDTASKVAGSGRFAAWEQALERLYEPNPATGSGIGASQDMFYGGSARATNVSAVHSEIIRLLCDLGLIGMTLYLLGWFQLLLGLIRFNAEQRRSADGTPNTEHPLQRALVVAALGSSLAYLLFLLTDNGFDYVAQISMFVYATVGAALGLRRPALRVASLAADVERTPRTMPQFTT